MVALLGATYVGGGGRGVKGAYLGRYSSQVEW